MFCLVYNPQRKLKMLSFLLVLANSYQNCTHFYEVKKSAQIFTTTLKRNERICLNITRSRTAILLNTFAYTTMETFTKCNQSYCLQGTFSVEDNIGGFWFGDEEGIFTIQSNQEGSNFVSFGAAVFPFNCDDILLSNSLQDSLYITAESQKTYCYFNSALGDNRYEFNFSFDPINPILVLYGESKPEHIFASTQLIIRENNSAFIMRKLSNFSEIHASDFGLKFSSDHNYNSVFFKDLIHSKGFRVIYGYQPSPEESNTKKYILIALSVFVPVSVITVLTIFYFKKNRKVRNEISWPADKEDNMDEDNKVDLDPENPKTYAEVPTVTPIGEGFPESSSCPYRKKIIDVESPTEYPSVGITFEDSGPQIPHMPENCSSSFPDPENIPTVSIKYETSSEKAFESESKSVSDSTFPDSEEFPTVKMLYEDSSSRFESVSISKSNSEPSLSSSVD
ncbi:hypothetical protein GPJ56_004641 [Histomonas meleagridis]|uniref:uncharacterized protein n=1 Tax=Histomonas meleagridis TaxID=135588 RepID=UPI0035593843|nr:hypothetical protein GPJ56_004641 [Histomonas meleagridis]KAH0797402.1 hypothetical protein GO595_009723 [Histomonas meleagridis]